MRAALLHRPHLRGLAVARGREDAADEKENPMSQLPNPDLAPAPVAPYLDAERLDCYRVALEFHQLVPRLVTKGHRELRDQLQRAALSSILNLAEGLGRSSGSDKARFYSIAKGSSSECAAIVDVVRSMGLAPGTLCREARSLLVRVIQMLTKLEASVRGR
jgi:four helix bundle protein